MHEQNKLDEARHFLAGMTRAVEDPTCFRFELSAFLPPPDLYCNMHGRRQ